MADLAQLTKANSIEGNKKDNVTVIYTPWSNLKKDGGMAVGQVGFKDPRKVRRVLVAQRENPIVNRLNKTRVEVAQPDLRQEREDHLRQLRKKDQATVQARVSYPWRPTPFQPLPPPSALPPGFPILVLRLKLLMTMMMGGRRKRRRPG